MWKRQCVILLIIYFSFQIKAKPATENSENITNLEHSTENFYFHENKTQQSKNEPLNKKIIQDKNNVSNETNEQEQMLEKSMGGSDRGLFNENMIEGDILRPMSEKNAVANKNLLWPQGVIYYTVDESVGCPYSYYCKLLYQAMQEYHRKTCLRFREWNGQRDYVQIFQNSDRNQCWSNVGRQGGRQLLSLGQQCWYKGIVLHELAHTAGFWHEMNRPDRDYWIKIYWNNIQPAYISAFHKYSWYDVDTLGEDFDYTSVMLYDEYAFSKDGVSPTILPTVSGAVIGPLWKKYTLSPSDVRRINKLYDCY